MVATAPIVGDAVTLATGDARPIAAVYPDGAYTCPWCGAAVLPTDTAWATRQCLNPACLAYPAWSADAVRAELDRRETQRQEEEARRARVAWSLEQAEQRRQQEADQWAAYAEQARKRGACLLCLRRSPWWGDRPKFVRHRSPDYHDTHR